MTSAAFRIHRKRHLFVSILLLVIMLVIQEYSGLDMRVQQWFYGTDGWVLDYSDPVPRFVIYQLPRMLLIIYAAMVLLLLVLSIRLKRLVRFRTRSNVFIVLCLVLVPALISAGKQETHAHCPHQYQEFGGPIPYVTLLETNKTPHDGRCFPAGHASGGFALLLFVMIASTRRRQMVALGGAMTLGWAMGGYQMLNGRHFLSHTLATILIAWIIILIVHLLLFRNRPIPAGTRGSGGAGPAIHPPQSPPK
ncbi:phosphatase PAP2 family protein [Profundibacter sp.]